MEEWKSRLKMARESAGLKKTDFASLVGVSNPTVTDWEKSSQDGGIREIAAVRLARICEVLKVDSLWLLHGQAASDAQSTAPIAPAPAQPPEAQQRPARMVLAYDDEEQLLDAYRRADERGQRLILRFAAREARQADNVFRRHG